MRAIAAELLVGGVGNTARARPCGPILFFHASRSPREHALGGVMRALGEAAARAYGGGESALRLWTVYSQAGSGGGGGRMTSHDVLEHRTRAAELASS